MIRTLSPCEQVVQAVACCGIVAKLYKKYGGPFVAIDTRTKATGALSALSEQTLVNGPVSQTSGAKVKAPARGYSIKRTIKGWKS